MIEKVVIEVFVKNLDFYKEILVNVLEKEVLWKVDEKMWCLLEFVCYLFDEEKEDFKVRIEYFFEYFNIYFFVIDL